MLVQQLGERKQKMRGPFGGCCCCVFYKKKKSNGGLRLALRAQTAGPSTDPITEQIAANREDGIRLRPRLLSRRQPLPCSMSRREREKSGIFWLFSVFICDPGPSALTKGIFQFVQGEKRKWIFSSKSWSIHQRRPRRPLGSSLSW